METLLKLPFALKQRMAGMRLKVSLLEARGQRPRWTDKDIALFKDLDDCIYPKKDRAA